MTAGQNSKNEVQTGLKPLYPRLWRFCISLTGSRDKASDLAQATCLRALEKSHLYQAGTRLDSWLFLMAKRLWLNELRSEAIRRGGGISPIEEIELRDDSPDPEANFYAQQVLSEVMALPEALRVTVVLVYGEGYAYREAAEILEIPIGTVMSRLAAARSNIAGKFKGQKSKTA